MSCNKFWPAQVLLFCYTSCASTCYIYGHRHVGKTYHLRNVLKRLYNGKLVPAQLTHQRLLYRFQVLSLNAKVRLLLFCFLIWNHNGDLVISSFSDINILCPPTQVPLCNTRYALVTSSSFLLM